jgi:hypothetical protein
MAWRREDNGGVRIFPAPGAELFRKSLRIRFFVNRKQLRRLSLTHAAANKLFCGFLPSRYCQP